MGIQPFKKIAILGHVGTKNLGDEAIIAAVIHQIGKRYPTAQIIGFTGDPDDTRARHGIPAFPIWLLSGLLVWNLFSTGLGAAT